MNFDFIDEQEMVCDIFVCFFDENFSIVCVWFVMDIGFDLQFWYGLVEFGVFVMCVFEDVGGMGMGLFDVVLLMEEVGCMLVLGLFVEVLVVVCLLGQIGGEVGFDLFGCVILGEVVVIIVLYDIVVQLVQWIVGGKVVEVVIVCKGECIVVVMLFEVVCKVEEMLVVILFVEIDFGVFEVVMLGSGVEVLVVFVVVVEEWKIYFVIVFVGFGCEVLWLGFVYVCECKVFGQLIGIFQGILYLFVDFLCDVDGVKFLVWCVICEIFDGIDEVVMLILVVLWYVVDVVVCVVLQLLYIFGGYGLLCEYDIYFFVLCVKEWLLVFGDL